jgi:hypothetical protein
MSKYIQRVTRAAARTKSSRYLSLSAVSAPAGERGPDGRFRKAQAPSPAVVAVLTRQQRRHAERHGEKP